MVRTRGENCARRAVAAKAPRKQLGCSSSSILSSPGSKEKYNSGNPVRWTPTPTWQKGIGNFFQKCNSVSDESTTEPQDDAAPSTSASLTTGHEPLSEIIATDE